MINYKIIDFKVFGGDLGSLVALEKGENFPFDIKRVYYMWNVPSHARRGFHAHRTLKQVIVCLSGHCDFILDNGKEKTSLHLDNPAQGLYLSQPIWREFTNFSDNCVIMVLASDYYDENDYIRNYDEFLKFVC